MNLDLRVIPHGPLPSPAGVADALGARLGRAGRPSPTIVALDRGRRRPADGDPDPDVDSGYQYADGGASTASSPTPRLDGPDATDGLLASTPTHDAAERVLPRARFVELARSTDGPAFEDVPRDRPVGPEAVERATRRGRR